MTALRHDRAASKQTAEVAVLYKRHQEASERLPEATTRPPRPYMDKRGGGARLPPSRRGKEGAGLCKNHRHKHK